jgi:hypothetical protein
MKGLVSSAGYTFDEEVLEIHHSVPGLKMDGFDKEPLPYEIGNIQGTIISLFLYTMQIGKNLICRCMIKVLRNL